MRTVYGDHQRFIDTYFKAYPGKYFTGDGCRRDADGYYWITGRVDDVINVAGHRMGTAEVESALVAHDEGVGGRRRRLSARHQGPGHLRLCDADDRRAADRGAAQGAGAVGAQGDRPDRLARPDPVRARPAEDALRQDHAPHPAQDRRGRVRQSRRHLDARRSGGGRRPGEQPAEQEGRAPRPAPRPDPQAFPHAFVAARRPRHRSATVHRDASGHLPNGSRVCSASLRTLCCARPGHRDCDWVPASRNDGVVQSAKARLPALFSYS